MDATQIGEAQPLVSPPRAGMTDTVAVAWTVPITATGRDIWVLVDPYAEVLESDETNNLAHVRAVFPDLLVSSMYADYAAPDTIQISTTLSNRGVAPATDVVVAWRRDAVTGTLLAETAVGSIAAGGSQEVGLTWRVSPADAGEHVVYAVVDPANAILEMDETNNADLAAADVLPDLALGGSYVEVGLGGRPPDPLPITLVLDNRGVADARDVRVRVAPAARPGAGAAVLYETVIPKLAAGEEVVLTTGISVPGWEDVYAMADPEWAIPETNESNNLALLVEFPPRRYLPLLLR